MMSTQVVWSDQPGQGYQPEIYFLFDSYEIRTGCIKSNLEHILILIFFWSSQFLLFCNKRELLKTLNNGRSIHTNPSPTPPVNKRHARGSLTKRQHQGGESKRQGGHEGAS